ncbi:MAG: DUF5676 family membrane protein [Nanoarchaeota archaeon]
MTETLSARKVSFSLATVAGIVSIICALLLVIAPEATTNVFGAIFHGIDLSQITKPVTWGGVILGTAEVVILALVAGWLFTKVYNRL